MADSFKPDETTAEDGGGANSAGRLVPSLGPTSGFPPLVRPNSAAPLLYPNGVPVIDPNTKEPYPAPSGIDVLDNVARGAALAPFANMWTPDGPIDGRVLPMITWFRQGGTMDYQRPDGYFAALLFHRFRGDLTHVTNYNFRVVAAAAGYSLDEALSAAGLHNRWVGRPDSSDTSWGISQDAVNNITQGWNDSRSGSWRTW